MTDIVKVTDEELVTLGDWDHLLPQEEWDRVVARASEIAAERASLQPGARGVDAPLLTAKYVDFPNSPYDKSGTLRRKQLWVVHTIECPLKIGYAESLTEWADGDSYKPRVSWHRAVDPATVARFIKITEASWHATWANPISIGYEQSGYAAYGRSTWLTPLGLAQISLLAQQMVIDGIPAAAVRKLSNSEVLAVKNGNTTITGLCSHAAINPETRTDPGAGYPWDVLIDFIKQFHPAFKTPLPEPEPVQTLEVNMVLVRIKGTAPIFVSNGVERRWVQNPTQLAGVVRAIRAEGGKAVVTSVTAQELEGFGALVGTAPPS